MNKFLILIMILISVSSSLSFAQDGDLKMSMKKNSRQAMKKVTRLGDFQKLPYEWSGAVDRKVIKQILSWKTQNCQISLEKNKGQDEIIVSGFEIQKGEVVNFDKTSVPQKLSLAQFNAGNDREHELLLKNSAVVFNPKKKRIQKMTFTFENAKPGQRTLTCLAKGTEMETAPPGVATILPSKKEVVFAPLGHDVQASAESDERIDSSSGAKVASRKIAREEKQKAPKEFKITRRHRREIASVITPVAVQNLEREMQDTEKEANQEAGQ